MTSRSPSSSLSWVPLALGGVLVLLLLVGLFSAARSGEAEPDAVASDALQPGGVSAETRELGESLARRAPGDPMALGDPEAPVVLIAYSDYNCPFCATWVHESQPELVERYVDKGELRIEWREFPYLGEESETLAVGAMAAAEQDEFWAYHEAVYAAQKDVEEESGTELTERMVKIADEAGLDPDRFADDLRSEDLAAEVDADFTEGQQIGVSGTPAFLINGDPVMGAQPLAEFIAAVDRALAEAEG